MHNLWDINKLVYVDCTGIPYPDNEEEAKTPIQFCWGMNGFGWGTTTFYYENGVLKCDNECMSKEMIKQLLCAFVDRAVFDDRRE